MVKTNRDNIEGENNLLRPHGFPSIVNAKKIRYNDVPTTYSPTPDAGMNQLHGRNLREKTLHFLSCKRRPKLVIFLTYLSIFMLGVALGFTPFIKVYIETCQDDRQIVSTLPPYFKSINNSMDEIRKLFRELNDTKTENLLQQSILHHPWFTDSYKHAYGVGNSNITLTCNGKIKVLFIEFSGTEGNQETLDRFNTYCASNSKMIDVSNRNECVVSIEIVFEVPFNDKEAYTMIKYRCEHD